MTNCRFSDNTANYNGGGMANDYSNLTVTNCTFTGNTASSTTWGGGGMLNASSSPTLTNCTFVGNTAVSASGGAIRNWDSDPIVTNCILWYNLPDQISSEFCTPTVTYNDVEGGHAGTGNIDANPEFVDANGDNLHLLSESPCIDAVDSTAVPSCIFVDLDGNPRGVDAPATPDTGISVLGVTVDMGAYEFQPCPIDGDINCDGKVDLKDFAILAGNWLEGV